MHKEIANAIEIESEKLNEWTEGQGDILLLTSKKFATFALENYADDLLQKALKLSAALAEYHFEIYPPDKEKKT